MPSGKPRTSIQKRLLLASSLVLGAFLGLAGLSLDTAWQRSTEVSQKAQLQAHIHTLLATADEDELGRLRLPPHLAAPRFNHPESGLYAQIAGKQDGYRWRSASLLGSDAEFPQSLQPGQSKIRIDNGHLIMEQGFAWETLDGSSIDYVLSVSMDMAEYRQASESFRGTLWQWLGGSALVLLLSQLLLMRWGLSPLRDIAQRIRRIEAGDAKQIEGPVSQELKPLTDSINALIQAAETRQERVRNSLADLAHSLKTPLAVLRGGAEQTDASREEMRHLIVDQTEHIDRTVRYFRQRASVAGKSQLHAPVALSPLIQRITNGLGKVYADKAQTVSHQVNDDFSLRIEEADLFELFGNLLENAFKYGHQQIVISISSEGHLMIEDDGPGIPTHLAEQVLKRGVRADETQPGQGIGLAVAADICRQYGGQLHIQPSTLGGAAIVLQFSSDQASS